MKEIGGRHKAPVPRGPPCIAGSAGAVVTLSGGYSATGIVVG